jgi:hypothetical protein
MRFKQPSGQRKHRERLQAIQDRKEACGRSPYGIDVTAIVSGVSRPFKFRKHGQEVSVSNAPDVQMDGVAAGSRRVGPFQHSRFGEGLTISLDLAPGEP